MILNDEQLRVMEFIAFVNRGGYRPTGSEINEWRLRPDIKSGRKGKLLEPEVKAVPERRVRVGGMSSADALLIGKGFGVISEALKQQMSIFTNTQMAGLNANVLRAMNTAGLANSAIFGSGGEYKTIPGKPGKAAVYGPDKPPERFLAHLRRLGWIERTKGGYGVTLLGHALLRSEAASELGDDDSSVMVLAADDELAYGRVMGIIAECDDAFIMDAYLGTDELASILRHTTATRFLVGDKLPKNRRTELAVLIELEPPGADGATRQLKQAAFHDRWVVGDQKLYGLGASINGVGGKAMTTLVEMPDAAARFIRAAAEKLWDEAALVAETRHVVEDADEHMDDAAEPAKKQKNIRKEGDKYFHDGCTVKHKSEEAAQNCTKGE